MRWLGILWLCAILPVEIVAAGEESENGWKTYRSEKFGYELSYPPEMECIAYFEGSSGELKNAGGIVASFEVWPSDECPRQPAGAIAREIGIQRAKDLTQADGHGSSSYCGDPVTVRDVASLHGVKIYELELSCVSETYTGPDDDEMDAEQDAAAIDAEPIIANVGKKWPTYFADISQPWRKVVLMLDPIGNNPLSYEDRDRIDMPIMRTILASLKTFSVQKSPAICIEDLPKRTPSIRGVIMR